MQQADLDDLFAVAVRHDLALQVAVMPGDHVLEGDPLVLVRGDDEVDDGTARSIRSTFAIGVERTPDQDVRFALQQLIEVAVRGLASGTNDPYTTVSAFDLARVPLVPLVSREEGARARYDEDGALRLAFAWPTAASLVGDVLASLRQYGLDHPSVVRARLDIAARLRTAARSADVRAALDDGVEALMVAYAASSPDGPDLVALQARAREVLAVRG